MRYKLLFAVCLLAIAMVITMCTSEDNPTFPEFNYDGSGDSLDDVDGDGDPSTRAINDTSGFKGTWDLDRSNIVLGCTFGQDCIASLDVVNFIPASSAGFIEDDDVVYGIVVDGQAYAYPEKLLDWHEIANHNFGSSPISMTYCPLTGSAVAFIPPVDDQQRGNSNHEQFGVSGFLFNNNLIPYDRVTGSAWSQMYMRSVNGILRGQPARTHPHIETTWRTWQEMFPESRVISDQTGFDRDYDVFPYGNYKEVESTLFGLTHEDNRLFFKERVHGIVSDRFNPSAKTYRFTLFEDGARAINDEFDGLQVVVAGMKSAHVYVSFSRVAADGTVLEFDVKTENPSIYPFDLIDNEGNVWNLLGEAVSGSRTGQKLEPTASYNAYWFAWGAFFPGVPLMQ